ncbi:hypothetical protein TrRE_jg2714, partial [Triparma retinervis]
SSFSSISSLESDSGNNFIQPEGDASRLPQDCVDLTSRLRSVPYSDLLPLFKKELSKLSNSTLPDCRLRLSRFKRKTRSLLDSPTLTLDSLHDLESSNLALFTSLKSSLGLHGRDLLREILRKLHGRSSRPYRKAHKNWALKLETTDMEFDQVEGEVEEVLQSCKEHLMGFEVWGRERFGVEEGYRVGEPSKINATQMMERFLSNNENTDVNFDDIPDSDTEPDPRPTRRVNIATSFKKKQKRKTTSFLKANFPSRPIPSTKFLKALKALVLSSPPSFAASLLPVLESLDASSVENDLLLTLFDVKLTTLSTTSPRRPQLEQELVDSAISTVLDQFYQVHEISSPESDVNAVLKSICLGRSPLESLFDTLAAVQESLMDSFASVLDKKVLKAMGLNISRCDIAAAYFIFGAVAYFSTSSTQKKIIGSKPQNGASALNLLAKVSSRTSMVLSHLPHDPMEDSKFPDSRLGKRWHRALSEDALRILVALPQGPSASTIIQLFKGKLSAVSKLDSMQPARLIPRTLLSIHNSWFDKIGTLGKARRNRVKQGVMGLAEDGNALHRQMLVCMILAAGSSGVLGDDYGGEEVWKKVERLLTSKERIVNVEREVHRMQVYSVMAAGEGVGPAVRSRGLRGLRRCLRIMVKAMAVANEKELQGSAGLLDGTAKRGGGKQVSSCVRCAQALAICCSKIGIVVGWLGGRPGGGVKEGEEALGVFEHFAELLKNCLVEICKSIDLGEVGDTSVGCCIAALRSVTMWVLKTLKVDRRESLGASGASSSFDEFGDLGDFDPDHAILRNKVGRSKGLGVVFGTLKEMVGVLKPSCRQGLGWDDSKHVLGFSGGGSALARGQLDGLAELLGGLAGMHEVGALSYKKDVEGMLVGGGENEKVDDLDYVAEVEMK